MDIAALLRRLGLEQYELAFREADIGSAELPSVTAVDLKDIGVTTIGHRRRILKAIADAMSNEEAKFEYEKVKTLFDYTKFHIGLYTTLGTLIVGVINIELPVEAHLSFCPGLLWAAVLFIVIAGLAGGIVASTLPEQRSLPVFFERRIGFWFWDEVWSGRTWTRIEHTAFWLALSFALLSFFVGAS